MSASPAARAAITASAPNPLVTATMRTEAGSAEAESMRRRTSVQALGEPGAAGPAGRCTVTRRPGAGVRPDDEGLAPAVPPGPVGEVAAAAGRAGIAPATCPAPAAARAAATAAGTSRAGRPSAGRAPHPGPRAAATASRSPSENS